MMEGVRIDRVRLVHVPVELVSPLRTSGGAHQSRIATLVEVTDESGNVGWGENVAPSTVDYTGEQHDRSVAAMSEVLVPTLVSRNVDVHEMHPEQWWGVDGWNMAKHALESAVWDVEARRAGTSLSRLLGGVRDHVAPGVVVGMADSIDLVVQECLSRVAEGYSRVKVKIAPGWDLDVVKAVREAIGATVTLQVDANASYEPTDIARLVLLAESDVQFIEQPFAADNLGAHAALEASATVRVCLDESVMTRDQLSRAIEMHACSVVNIKPSRVGGIGEAVAMHDMLQSRGVDAWVGGMLETGIGRASCLALASLPGFTLTPDLSASNRYFRRDVTAEFTLHNGCIAVPDGPGIGVVLRADVLDAPGTRTETVFER